MEDHPHGDDVRLRKGVLEKVTSGRLNAICQAGFVNVPLRDWRDWWQIEGRAFDIWMTLGDLD